MAALKPALLMAHPKDLNPAARPTLLAAWLAREQMTLSAFAARVGVAPGVVSRWANGHRRPTAGTRSYIATLTGGEVRADAW